MTVQYATPLATTITLILSGAALAAGHSGLGWMALGAALVAAAVMLVEDNG